MKAEMRLNDARLACVHQALGSIPGTITIISQQPDSVSFNITIYGEKSPRHKVQKDIFI